MIYEPPRPARFVANCIKCTHIVSAKSPEEIQRQLEAHVRFMHPLSGLRPIVETDVTEEPKADV